MVVSVGGIVVSVGCRSVVVGTGGPILVQSGCGGGGGGDLVWFRLMA